MADGKDTEKKVPVTEVLEEDDEFEVSSPAAARPAKEDCRFKGPVVRVHVCSCIFSAGSTAGYCCSMV